MFAFPVPPGYSERPVYDGNGFVIGSQRVPLLVYEPGVSGWTDDLTNFHEDLAGDSHPIDVASRNRAIAELRKHLRTAKPTVIDIGCSSGFFLRDLRKAMPEAELIGADYVQGPLRKLASRMPGIPLLQFNAVKCPLPDACVDAAVLLNVFEHIDQDVEAMRQVCRILKPGGVAVIELPAGEHLYDVYDKHLMHFRRYELGDLKRRLVMAGFQIESASHLGSFVYPMFRSVKLRNRRYLNAPEEEQKRVVAESISRSGSNPLMKLAMQAELALGRFVSYPAGIRCVVTCRK